MKHRMFRIVIAVILVCALLVSWSPIRARAFAGGGVIGGASAAGLALSPGMVGLLLLAAFGVYYMADNEDAIGRSLEVLLEAEATNTELSLAAQAEYAAALTSWWESAKAGAIELSSAPSWIVDTVKSWANGFLSGSSSIVGEHIPTYTAGSFLSARTSYSYAPGCSAMFYEDGYICPFYCYSSSVPNYHQLCFVFYPADGSGVSYTVNGNSGSTQNWYCYGNKDVLSKPDSLSLSGLAIYDGNASDGARYYAGLMARGESIPYYTANVALYPDVITGGFTDQLSSGVGMDVIGLPDIVIPGPDVLPVNPSEGQTTAQAVTDYLMAALIAGEITWEQYWQLIGVYNPAIGSSVPTVGTVDPVTGTITNTEISTGTVVTPSAITDYSIDLTSFFPFCLPFDIYAFFELLAAEPETPHLEFDIELPFMQEPWHVVIDLSAWDSTALLARRLELLAFIIGLCVFTREKFLRS